MGDRFQICFYGAGRLSGRAYHHWGGDRALVVAQRTLVGWHDTDPDAALAAYVEDHVLYTDRVDPNPMDPLPLPLSPLDWDACGDRGLVVIDLEARLVLWAETRGDGVDCTATVLAATETAPVCVTSPCPACGYDGWDEYMLCGARDYDLPAWVTL